MATESLIKSEQASSSSNVVCENGVCRRVEKEPSPSTSSSQDESTEAKVERAKELIEKKREEKEQEEKEVGVEAVFEKKTVHITFLSF